MPLVTGAAGQVGSYVVDRLRERGDGPVRGLDLRESPWTTHVGDVRRGKDVEAALAGCRAVVHCAAQVSVQRSVEDPRFDASHNVEGTLQALEAARRADVERFVYFSSAAVYGDPVAAPVAEDHPTRPMSPYGLSKLTGERYALLYHDLYGLPVVALRPFNIYSPRQDPSSPYSGVISKFAERLAAGEPPVIFGDGEQTRDFVHARDVVRAVEVALDHPDAVGGVFNVATGAETTINGLAARMAEAAGRPDLEARHGAAREGEIRRSVADVSALRALGYAPEVPLAAGLRGVMRDAAGQGR